MAQVPSVTQSRSFPPKSAASTKGLAGFDSGVADTFLFETENCARIAQDDSGVPGPVRNTSRIARGTTGLGDV